MCLDKIADTAFCYLDAHEEILAEITKVGHGSEAAVHLTAEISLLSANKSHSTKLDFGMNPRRLWISRSVFCAVSRALAAPAVNMASNS